MGIEASKDGVRFSCQGDIGSGSVTVRQHSNVEKPDNDVTINLTEPVSLTFSLKYLSGYRRSFQIHIGLNQALATSDRC